MIEPVIVSFGDGTPILLPDGSGFWVWSQGYGGDDVYVVDAESRVYEVPRDDPDTDVSKGD